MLLYPPNQIFFQKHSLLAYLQLTKWYNIPAMFKKQVKCSECGFLGDRTVDKTGKYGEIEELPPSGRFSTRSWTSDDDSILSCACGQEHLVLGIDDPTGGIPVDDLHSMVVKSHRCKYFILYSPGHSPRQHFELQKEKAQRRFLLIVSLLSATVGAAIATVVNLVWSQFR